MKYILVGSAWPYANGSLHIGHIAALLPGDIIARYHRAKKDKVYYVSGSDCHGTAVAIRAKQENKTPQEISDFYHEEFCHCFKELGFSYDIYTKTSSKEHIQFVKEFHEQLYESSYIYEKETPQAFCEHCNTFLAERFVTGTCPECGSNTRGDQCDSCGTVLEAENLGEPVCVICGGRISFKDTKHLYIGISKLNKELQDFINEHPNWRKNAITFSKRYIREGLRDRALTRDLEWGIDVPKARYENKKIYIWAENVLGYLSASKTAATIQEEFDNLWKDNAKPKDELKAKDDIKAKDNVEAENKVKTKDNVKDYYNVRHYYVHGKDNIPFHTIILPSLLIANNRKWHLPDEIISSEYLTLEGKKISTSHNYAIWVKDIIGKYNADSLRYYLTANGPEKKDSDFSWRDYVNSHNSELLGAYGNFIHRSLAFINKYLGGIIPEGKIIESLERDVDSLYIRIGNLIEKGNFREAVSEIFELVRWSNKYFDTEQPWITRNTNLDTCNNTLFNCVQIIANLSVLLYPFLPFSSEKVCGWLKIDSDWKPHFIKAGYKLPEIQILFERLDKKIIDEEVEKLKELTAN